MSSKGKAAWRSMSKMAGWRLSCQVTLSVTLFSNSPVPYFPAH